MRRSARRRGLSTAAPGVPPGPHATARQGDAADRGDRSTHAQATAGLLAGVGLAPPPVAAVSVRPSLPSAVPLNGVPGPADRCARRVCAADRTPAPYMVGGAKWRRVPTDPRRHVARRGAVAARPSAKLASRGAPRATAGSWADASLGGNGRRGASSAEGPLPQNGAACAHVAGRSTAEARCGDGLWGRRAGPAIAPRPGGADRGRSAAARRRLDGPHSGRAGEAPPGAGPDRGPAAHRPDRMRPGRSRLRRRRTLRRCEGKNRPLLRHRHGVIDAPALASEARAGIETAPDARSRRARLTADRRAPLPSARIVGKTSGLRRGAGR